MNTDQIRSTTVPYRPYLSIA